MPPSNQSDTSLITQLRQGNVKVFDQLFADQHARVYAYCRRFVKREELAQEVTLDVFMTVWKKRTHLDSTLSLNALLFKITKDLSFNCLKKAARQRAFQSELAARNDHSATNVTEEQVQWDEYDKMAARAIGQLPPQRQRIFAMRREQDMSYEEIAEQLGISKNTVKVQLVKASKFLREYFATHADISFFWILLLLSV